MMVRKRRETIQVADGVVTILRPAQDLRILGLSALRSDADLQDRAYPLSACRWYIWRFRRTMLPSQRDTVRVCLRLPTPVLGIDDADHTKCCATPEMRAIWEGFLTLAEVPRKVGLWQVLCQSVGKMADEEPGAPAT